jgi:hypothetical protein
MAGANLFRARVRLSGWLLGGLFFACALAPAQQPNLAQLVESGQIVVDGVAESARVFDSADL